MFDFVILAEVERGEVEDGLPDQLVLNVTAIEHSHHHIRVLCLVWLLFTTKIQIMENVRSMVAATDRIKEANLPSS